MSQVTKYKLLGIKTVKLSGWKFKIKRLNPLIDFEPDKMPQIFTSFQSQRKVDDSKWPEERQRKVESDIKEIVKAGVVEPLLVKVANGDGKGREGGITVNDLFRDPDLGYRLYVEIMAHSLNYFKGLKGLFFYLKIKQLLLMPWQKDTENYRQSLSFSQAMTLR